MSLQLNVQQQNNESEACIRSTATYWRHSELPEALRVHGQRRGIEWSRSIIVRLDIDFPGMPRLFGLLLTQDERFIRFELDTDEAHRLVESADEWLDVTADQNIETRNRATGVGNGALAIRILHELNADMSYLIRSEADGDDVVLRCRSIKGLPPEVISEESANPLELVVVMDGMATPESCSTLRPGTVYTIYKLFREVGIEAACIYCKECQSNNDSRHRYAVLVGRSFMPKVQIVDAWLAGIPVSWRELHPDFGYLWISACMSLASPRNWRQTLVTGPVVLDVTGLRTEDDFYCLLGEALFGYRGYAGSNLAAFEDVLRHNDPARISFSIPDEAEFDAFLARTARRQDCAEVFKQIVRDAGAALSIERRTV